MNAGIITIVIISIFFGASFVIVFNGIPARWLCDYGERPNELLRCVRLKRRPWIAAFSLFFFAAAIFLTARYTGYFPPETIQFEMTGGNEMIAMLFDLSILWFVLQAALADIKYGIIPDQWIAAMAAIGVLSLFIGHSSLFSHLGYRQLLASHIMGLLIGGMSYLLAALMGSLLFRREVIGFGDVKLLAAVGFAMGATQAVRILIMTAFSSAASFAVLMLFGKVKANDEQPLGPFVAFATAVVILFLPMVR